MVVTQSNHRETVDLDIKKKMFPRKFEVFELNTPEFIRLYKNSIEKVL